MKKRLLSLVVLTFFGASLSAQNLIVSVSAKGNLAFTNLALMPPSEIGNLSPDFFLTSNLDPGTSSPRIGFELGTDVRLRIHGNFHLSSGVYFQQLQYEIEQSLLFNPTLGPQVAFPIELLQNPIAPGGLFGANSQFISNRQLQYLKIPIGAGLSLINDQLFLQGGLYGAMLLHSKATLSNDFRQISLDDQPLLFTDFNGDLISSPDAESSPYNKLLMGLQISAQYNFFSKLSLIAAFERSLGNVLNDTAYVKENLNNLSLGFSWRIN